MRGQFRYVLLFCLLAIFGFSGCGGGGGGGSGGGATEPSPSPTASIPSGIPLGNSQAVVIRFSETMNPSTVSLGGALSMVAYSTAWSTTSSTNDTLTLTPASGWGSGSIELTIDGDDVDATPQSMATLTHTFHVYSGVLYFVDSRAVDDSGDGLSPETAKQTINAAIQQSVTDLVVPPVSVIVNSGTYNVDSALGTETHVVVVEGVSLYGSYSADFSERDTSTHASIIQDSSAESGPIVIPNRALEANGAITTATVIDGFTINGTSDASSDSGTGAFVINGADPYLKNNIYNGGESTTNIGLWVSGAGTSPVIENSTINGGNGITSYGMYVLSGGTPVITVSSLNGGNGSFGSAGFAAYNLGTNPELKNNTINGGTSAINSNGIILIDNASPFIIDNIINGGSGGSQSRGMVVVNGAAPTIQANTIDGGTGNDYAYGIITASGGKPIIQENVRISGGSSNITVGIETRDATTAARIENNTLIHGGAGVTLSYGVWAKTDSEITVSQNQLIDGGSGTACVAIYADGQAGSSVVERNRLIGGSCTDFTMGIINIDVPMPIHNNLIHGGTGNGSLGLSLEGVDSQVRNNTIYAGSTISFGISISGSSVAPIIENNIIYTGSATDGTCIEVKTSTSHPASIANNSLSGCTSAVYLDADPICDGSRTCSLIQMEALLGTYVNNTELAATSVLTDHDGADNNINTMADNDWTLNTSIGDIAAGGLNGNDFGGWEFTDDFAGVARPATLTGNWAMGAYEHP